MEKLKKYLDCAWVLALFLVVFLIFTRSIENGLVLFLGFFVFAFVPGLALIEYSLDNLNMFEKSLISGFIGIWLTPLIMYYLSLTGMKSVSIIVSVVFSFMCLIFIILKNKIKHKLSKDHEAP